MVDVFAGLRKALAWSVVLIFLLVLKPDPVAAATELPLSWGFIGEGFHMQFFIEVDTSHSVISFDLPPAFFIDVAEANEQMLITNPISGMTHSSSSAVLESDHFCDIEAPAFAVKRHNPIRITVDLLGLGMQERAKLLFPIHARYEMLDTSVEFSLWSLLLDEHTYTEKCINGVSSSGGTAYEATGSSQLHCRYIPVGKLSDLVFVYRFLMSLIVISAAFVVFSLSV